MNMAIPVESPRSVDLNGADVARLLSYLGWELEALRRRVAKMEAREKRDRDLSKSRVKFAAQSEKATRAVEVALARKVVPGSFAAILARVCEANGLRPADVIGRCRDAEFVAARKQVCVAAFQAGLSVRQIAKGLARDRTTITYLLNAGLVVAQQGGAA